MIIPVNKSMSTLYYVDVLSKLQKWICKVFKIIPQDRFSVETKIFVTPSVVCRENPIRINDVVQFLDGTRHIIVTFGVDKFSGRYFLTKSIDILTQSPVVGNEITLIGSTFPEN